MPDTLYTKLRKLHHKAALVFAAALDCNEGKITPQQLQRTAETGAWESEYLLDDLYFHARNLKVPGAGVIFTKNSNPGNRFLAEIKKPWMEPETRIILPQSLLRYINKIPLHEPRSMITRRTRLDLLLGHVFLRSNASSKGLTLKTDLDWAYSGLPYPYEDYTTCTCYGVPYYSVWYGPLEDLATNFVIVHTETPGYFDEGEVHVYMGMLHLARLRSGKANCQVYGLATDSNEFWFYQIDNKGKWSHTLLKPVCGSYDKIASLLVSILHEAYLASIYSQTSNKISKSQLTIRDLPFQGTQEPSYERLLAMDPPGLDTWIN